MAGNYTYKPLSTEHDEIRVVELLPGGFTDHITLKLHHVPFVKHRSDTVDNVDVNGDRLDPNFYEQLATQYEALSYVWGDCTNMATIYIIDAYFTWTLVVTRNCEEALRYLRFPEEQRFLWVDAICINQADLGERARQVMIMFAIYSQAAHVNVWLGPAANESDLAMQWIDDVGARVTWDYSAHQLHQLTDDSTLLEDSEVLATGRQRDALYQLFTRPWWQRLWVWQEVRAGRDCVNVICGRVSVPWQKLLNTAAYLQARQPVGSEATVINMWLVIEDRARFINDLLADRRSDPLWHLDTMRSCHCMDQRDRIYTADVVGDVPQNLKTIPDYTLTVAETYTNFVLAWIKRNQSLGFLSYAGVARREKDAHEYPRLASWVPDWTLSTPLAKLEKSYASGFSMASVIAADSDSLIVKGMVIGRVVDSIGYGVKSMTKAYIHWKALCNMLSALPPALKDEDDILERLTNALCCDFLADRRDPPVSGYPYSDEFQAFVLGALDEDRYSLTPEQHDRCIKSTPLYCGRSLLIAEDGRLALGPNTTQQGDILAVLLGFDLAAVLRPVKPDPVDALPETSPAYQLVGECICEGYMAGEAFLGPLPQAHQIVQVWHDSGWKQHVRDDATGKTFPEDPRLPPLPRHWRTCIFEAASGRHISGFVNVQTGERRIWHYDPRMDASALEERGVKLEAFHLV